MTNLKVTLRELNVLHTYFYTRSINQRGLKSPLSFLFVEESTREVKHLIEQN